MSRHALETLWVIVHRALLLHAGLGGVAMDGDVITRGKSDGGPPPLAGAEIRHFERRWSESCTDAERKDVLRDAIAMVPANLAAKADPLLMRGTKEWREAIALDPRPSRNVAASYEVTHSTVCNYRKEFKALLDGNRPVV